MISEERHVVALFAKVALVAEVQRNPFEPDVQAALPAPGHLFETGFVAIKISKFRSGFEEIVTNRARLQAQWAKFYAHQHRYIEVLVFLVFDDLPDAGFTNFIVYLVGIEQHFWLHEKPVAKAHITTELGAEISSVHPKIEAWIAAVTNRDIFWVVNLGIESAF